MSVDAPRGRPARTEYRVLAHREGLSGVECRIHTGRTHQIRVHFQSIGCPLLMDDAYGGVRGARNIPGPIGDAARKLNRPALHAWKLAFRHPRSDLRMEWTAPIPADLLPLFDRMGLKL